MKTIGVLKEVSDDKRVCLLPEAVEKLIKMGLEVIVEENAASGLGIGDEAYTSAGATCSTAENVFDNSDLICSIGHRYDGDELPEPIAFLGIFNPLYFTGDIAIYGQHASAYSLDLLPRTTIAQSMDVLSSMASLSGYKAVMLASNYFISSFPMFTTAAGTLKPAKVLVLGAGVAGLQAIATAKRLGAAVEAFDVRSSAGEEVRSLGARFIEVDGAMESTNAGGYAIEQTTDFKEKQQALINKHAIDADIIICTANIPGRQAPILLRSNTIDQMKPGSVIVDLASEQGGNCELTKDGRSILQNGITILGFTHLSKTVPMAASKLLSNNYLNFIKSFVNDPESDLVKSTLVIKNGEIVHPKLIEMHSTI